MKCGGTKGAASSKDERGHFLVVGAICPRELKELLAFCDPNMLGFAGQFERFFFVNLDLVRDDGFGLRNVLWSQELLGTGAARSTLSVVVPFDIDGHWLPLWC